MRQKFHSLTLVLIALFMMLLSFASCSKLQDMLNEGNDDGDDDGGEKPVSLQSHRSWRRRLLCHCSLRKV